MKWPLTMAAQSVGDSEVTLFPFLMELLKCLNDTTLSYPTSSLRRLIPLSFNQKNRTKSAAYIPGVAGLVDQTPLT